ncbi:response regulator [Candidatus Woesebacteria bacterium]|nr:response regulator [Candidatus Woesebacteria bacterium]
MKKQHILLVEDDQFIQTLYRDLLKDAGYEVVAVDDGRKAFDQIKKDQWSLILLDVMIPSITGFEIIAKIKKEKVKVKTPIVFLTNLDSNEEDKKKLKLAKDYWIKSDMNPKQFLEKVANILR